jgi:hypothetical protein
MHFEHFSSISRPPKPAAMIKAFCVGLSFLFNLTSLAGDQFLPLPILTSLLAKKTTYKYFGYI